MIDADVYGEYGESLEDSEKSSKEKARDAAMIGDFFDEEEAGDEFMASKPWIGAMMEPTEPYRAVNSPPDADLELERAYGYRG